jgi:hypothetical protein
MHLAAVFLAAALHVPPMPHPAVEHAVNLATLTPDAAMDLAGKCGLYVVTLDTDTAPDDEDAAGPVVRDCLPSSLQVFRSVVLPAGAQGGEVLVVEGVLRVVRHDGFVGADGVVVPPMVQLRVEADRVR